MFNRILIANRGEIAVRIMRACNELGIETIAIYSTADKNSLHVKIANHSVCIGPASALDSYLNINAVISAAVNYKADAIHPGFGFLSENYEFAKICQEVGIKFIGPDYQSIFDLGQKSLAKEIMNKNGIPIIPGAKGSFTDAQIAFESAQKVGFPVIIKAVSGGGGRGIRVVEKEKDFINEFDKASREASVSFNDPSLYIEKFLKNPKHIEFQIIADNYGNTVCLGERDCSLQRRKQKLIEETPAVTITNQQRKEISEKLINTMSKIGYKSAGTVEFLYENGNFYFMEMNTRIQVEHTVTEVATSMDIIKEMIRIAAKEPLSLKQEDIKFSYHAIECRINADDPQKKFMPCAGQIENIFLPGGPGIRIDSGVYPKDFVSPFYDSMLMKIIAFDKTRELTIAKMIRALKELDIKGIKTNKDFLLQILFSDGFLKGDYSINFVENDIIT